MTREVIRPLRYIIAIDPGESTGLFVLHLTDTTVTVRYRYQGAPSYVLDWILGLLQRTRGYSESTAIVCERYTVSPNTGRLTQQSTPQKVNGQVEHLADSFGASFTLQSPGDAKAFASNELLRDVGFWSTPSDVSQRDANDVNDAARHAVLLLAKTRATLFDALISQ